VKKRLLFLTGAPGVGKTTVLLKTVDALRGEGFRVDGMVSNEVRTHGRRIGFEILDIDSNIKGWLANIKNKKGSRIGKYYVNLEDLNNIGARALLRGVECSDVIVIDEVGPMEACSKPFMEAARKTVESNKIVIGTIHWKMKNELTNEIRMRKDIELFTVTSENRDSLHGVIVRKAREFLEGNKDG
jgi:nucleoside-triphosphatase